MGLLVTALIWASFVATTLWFPFRRGSIGFGVFVVTMAFNEIPLILLVVFVVSVVASLGDAAADGSAAVAAALGVSLLVTVGLVWLQVRARSVRPAFDAALSAGLGDDWRASVRPEFRMDAARPHAVGRGILLPFQRHLASVERVRNLPYAAGGRSHLLDIYRRKDGTTGQDRPTGRPVADPSARWRLRAGWQEPGERHTPESAGRARVVLRERRLRTQVPRGLPALIGRRETRDRVGARPCRRAGHRPGSDLHRRRIRRWPSRGIRGAHRRGPAFPARIRAGGHECLGSRVACTATSALAALIRPARRPRWRDRMRRPC